MAIIEIFLFFTSIALLIGFLSVLYFYVKLLNRLNSDEKQLNKHYLKKAKTQASEMVEEAGQEALSMLTASRTVSEKDQTMLEEVVKQVTDQQSIYLKTAVDQLMQEFRSELQQVKNYNINTLSNVSKNIESDTSARLNEYTKTLEEETVQSEKLVNKKIEDQYKQVQNELAAYKDTQLKKLDAAITSLLKKISIEVLEKSISPEDHREIILSALETAKKQSLFND